MGIVVRQYVSRATNVENLFSRAALIHTGLKSELIF